MARVYIFKNRLKNQIFLDTVLDQFFINPPAFLNRQQLQNRFHLFMEKEGFVLLVLDDFLYLPIQYLLKDFADV